MADERTKERKERNCNSSLDKKRDRSQSSSEDEDEKTKSNKNKSCKRSYRHSDSNTSSSTTPSDSEKRLEKKAKKKRRKRSSSSESSTSSDSDDKHSDSRTKKRKKKVKKETKSRHKKSKKKVKKKKKEKKEQGALDQNKYGKYGIITECELFVKQQEFYCWLLEVKNTNPETLPKFESRKMFEGYMEDYNTATFPHKKYYDLEKWEAKKQQKSEIKALKKARESSFTIGDDEKRHDMLHRRVGLNKYAGPNRQQLLEMQQELRRRQDEEYRKKAGLT